MADDPARPPKTPPDAAHRPGATLRHDLRTPINQIIGYSEMLDDDAAAAGQQKMSADLKRIGQAARGMLEMIDRIPDELAAPAPTAKPSSAATPPPPPCPFPTTSPARPRWPSVPPSPSR